MGSRDFDEVVRVIQYSLAKPVTYGSAVTLLRRRLSGDAAEAVGATMTPALAAAVLRLRYGHTCALLSDLSDIPERSIRKMISDLDCDEVARSDPLGFIRFLDSRNAARWVIQNEYRLVRIIGAFEGFDVVFHSELHPHVFYSSILGTPPSMLWEIAKTSTTRHAYVALTDVKVGYHGDGPRVAYQALFNYLAIGKRTAEGISSSRFSVTEFDDFGFKKRISYPVSVPLNRPRYGSHGSFIFSTLSADSADVDKALRYLRAERPPPWMNGPIKMALIIEPHAASSLHVLGDHRRPFLILERGDLQLRVTDLQDPILNGRLSSQVVCLVGNHANGAELATIARCRKDSAWYLRLSRQEIDWARLERAAPKR